MHRTEYDVNRILIWISSPQADKPFTRDTIINQLAPINFSLVDYVLSREVERGSIYGPTGKYYMRKDSYKMNDTEKRLSDLEVKYKWLEEIVAKMHYEKPKKQRLWSATAPIPRDVKYIDVMYNDGRIDENYYIGNMPHMGPTVLAWREAE